MNNESAYVNMSKDELYSRSARLESRLAHCDLCPRHCGVNRLDGELGFCGTGTCVLLASYCDHYGEEPVLSGTRGSGTLFFSGCNLHCVYCQNYQISQDFSRLKYEEVDSYMIADRMLYLQNTLGCHNINLVSPSHVVPQIVKALTIAVEKGLYIPLVYNTNAYDDMNTLKELDGIIDIYLPDIKYSSDKNAAEYSQAVNYVLVSHAAIKEMYRQVGNIIVNEQGLARKGLLVRHLILPNNISGSKECISWLFKDISTEVSISVMSQYYPCYKAHNIKPLARKLSRQECYKIRSWLETNGNVNGWVQEYNSAEQYLPDFANADHPFRRDS